MSSVVNASAEEVWATVWRFDTAAEWLPFVRSSPIEDGGGPTRVGRIPVLTQTDGVVFREVLVALSDAEHFYLYTFELDEPEFPRLTSRLGEAISKVNF